MKLSVPVAALAALALSSFASANYLIPPVSTTSVAAGDDSGANVSISGFSFYGSTPSSVFAATNGNLNLVGTTSTSPDNTIAGIISPLGDDHVFDTSALFSLDETPNYYAFTWNNPYNYGDGVSRHGFQAILVRQSSTIGGLDLQANDIVFAYSYLGAAFRNDNAFVGVGQGASNNTILPGANSLGEITRAQAETLLPTNDAYLLFRPNAAGTSYSQSVVSPGAVPEPATMAVLGLGALGLLKRRRK